MQLFKSATGLIDSKKNSIARLVVLMNGIPEVWAAIIGRKVHVKHEKGGPIWGVLGDGSYLANEFFDTICRHYIAAACVPFTYCHTTINTRCCTGLHGTLRDSSKSGTTQNLQPTRCLVLSATQHCRLRGPFHSGKLAATKQYPQTARGAKNLWAKQLAPLTMQNPEPTTDSLFFQAFKT